MEAENTHIWIHLSLCLLMLILLKFILTIHWSLILRSRSTPCRPWRNISNACARLADFGISGQICLSIWRSQYLDKQVILSFIIFASATDMIRFVFSQNFSLECECVCVNLSVKRCNHCLCQDMCLCSS